MTKFQLMAIRNLSLCFLFALFFSPSFSQDSRIQYPGFLKNSYFNFNFGYMNIPFSAEQLEPGYHVESITNHHFGMRLIFFGHQFTKHISAQISYMKPLQYAIYKNVNADQSKHSVWLHSGTLTVKGQAPLTNKLSVYGEGGLGIFGRRGFDINGNYVVKNASYSTVVLGTGLQYRISKNWEVLANLTYSPEVSKYNQPHLLFYSAGLKYNLIPLSEERIKKVAEAGYFFPKNIFQIGYSTNHFGYDANNFLSKKFAIFWGGGIEIQKGLVARYQRNLFHTKKVFAFDVGVDAGIWKSNEKKENFYTLSVFPTLRFTALRTKPADVYLVYSVAGPSYISQIIIDGKNSGRHFTFQDFMGFGGFMGHERKWNAEVSINHYSNGNIFPFNRGVKIPLTFTLGYSFK